MPSQALAWPNAIWLNRKESAIESTYAVNAPGYAMASSSLPREWRRMGIPSSHLGVDPRWLRASRERFQHEPDYRREYHQKANLVRLYLDDLTGPGTIQFWDRASRTYQPIEDEMTFTTHPSLLTWVWPQQGARR